MTLPSLFPRSMSPTSWTGQNRNQRLQDLMGYAIILVVAVRTLYHFARFGVDSVLPASILLAACLLLYAAQPLLSRRAAWYPYLYIPLYTVLALAVGLLQPYFDMWGGLFLATSMQVIHLFRRKVAIAWLLLQAGVVTIGLTLTQGVAGFATSLTYIAGIAGLVSFDLIYNQAETARQDSQSLLTDLQEANNRLVAYAKQAEELAATQERNRLARELHDTIHQEIFSITLNAQAARLLLDRDPARMPAQLDQLQEMAGGTLAKLRSLITQLHPPPKES